MNEHAIAQARRGKHTHMPLACHAQAKGQWKSAAVAAEGV